MEALIPNITIFEDRALKKVIKAKVGHKDKALIQYDCHLIRVPRMHTHKELPCEDTVRLLPASQEQKPQKKPNLSTS